MRVLVACEFSGIVRDAFIAKGHNAWSCDLLATEREGPHIQGDVLEHLNEGWDLMIAHPPCTYLSRAGAAHWHKPGRDLFVQSSKEFVFKLRDADIPWIAIENPIGKLNQLWRYPDQTIHPYHFGEPYSKATCLWLKNLPMLTPTNVLSNYISFVGSGQGRRMKRPNSCGVAKNAKSRSRTFQGIANAMADQWGNL